ncbi:MAG: GspH/FimT family protein [Burkholderiales bacterium]|nr:GspH/FimT family protein [Burkholderiales bacterium]
MKSRAAGFTLLEMLLTLALTALLMAVAVPTLSRLLSKAAVQSAADALVGDLRYARSEAIKRARTVSVCSSAGGVACASSAAWRDGWMVFVGRLDPEDQILRVQERLEPLASIASATPANDKRFIAYQASGMARAAAPSFILTPSGAGSASLVRVVCVSMQGRAALRASGVSACS